MISGEKYFMIKKMIQKILPEKPVHFIRMLRWRGIFDHLFCLVMGVILEWRYRHLNRDLGKERIAINREVVLNVNPITRPSIECFCHGDGDIGLEMMNFLHHTRDRKVLCDIGALHGCFSFCFTSRVGTNAYVIEPSPLAKEVFNENKRLNPTHSVEHYQTAMGSREGELNMSFAWHHLVAFDPAAKEQPERYFQIPITTLDLFFKDRPPADTLKIDVEGYEYEVIQGGKKFIREHQPLIFLEIHSRILRRIGIDPNLIFEDLKGLGYYFQNTRGEERTASQLGARGDDFRVLCLPRN